MKRRAWKKSATRQPKARLVVLKGNGPSGRLEAFNGDVGDEAVSRADEAVGAGNPLELAPPLKLSRRSAAWRHLASEVLAERQRFQRRDRKQIAGQVSVRMGFLVPYEFVREVEEKYGTPRSPGHRPDGTRHHLRPVRIKNTNRPTASTQEGPQ